jgi:O-acetyl-ADP-ribose deacetylase (regulator of RNase III)
MIQYVVGDATRPMGEGPKVITHICNDVGGWGSGFVVAISNRWPTAEAEYRRWHAEGGEAPFALGEVEFVEVEPSLWVANMIGQHGLRTVNGVPPVRYEAVEAALTKVAEFARAQSATVHMPRIGCGLAGGEWNKIEAIVDRTLVRNGIAVTVYDLEAKP